MHDAKEPQVKILLILSHYRGDIVRTRLIYDFKNSRFRRGENTLLLLGLENGMFMQRHW